MLEKLTQCIRQGAILEVVDTHERNASSHTHWHNALLPLAPRTHHSGPLTDAPSLCLSLSLHEKHSHWLFPLKGYLPKMSLAEPARQCL